MMYLSKKLNKQEKLEYVAICELMWGCVPINVDWAVSTDIYRQAKLRHCINKNLIESKTRDYIWARR